MCVKQIKETKLHNVSKDTKLLNDRTRIQIQVSPLPKPIITVLINLKIRCLSSLYLACGNSLIINTSEILYTHTHTQVTILKTAYNHMNFLTRASSFNLYIL